MKWYNFVKHFRLFFVFFSLKRVKMSRKTFDRSRVFLVAAGVLGFAGVLSATYASHGLPKRVSDASLVDVWNTGARYLLLHAPVVGLCAFVERPVVPGALLTSGVALFSGGLFLAALLEDTRVAALSAIGGTLLLAGWGALACASPRRVTSQ